MTQDTVLLGVISFALPFLIIAIVSWVLHYFIALSALPDRRAAWIVGAGYLAAALTWSLVAPDGYRWEGMLTSAPGALLVYLYWRWVFRATWFDDTDGVPEGVTLANTDWRVGLFTVGLLALAALFRVVLKMIWGH